MMCRTQRIGFHSGPYLGILQVGIDLGGSHIAVAQQLFQGQYIHSAGLIHQGGRRMAQFVGRKSFQAGGFHGAGNQLFHPPVGNALFAPPGDEDC